MYRYLVTLQYVTIAKNEEKSVHKLDKIFSEPRKLSSQSDWAWAKEKWRESVRTDDRLPPDTEIIIRKVREL